MALLSFSDILIKAGLDPKRVKLIRHALSDKAFKKCYDKNMVLEYTQNQSITFSQNYDYWCIFISDKSTHARFAGCYQVCGSVPNTPDVMPAGYPVPEMFCGNYAFYTLEHMGILAEYEDKLIIDWGKGTRSWHQKGSNEKPIISIQADAKKSFGSYENLIVTFDKLKEIVNDGHTTYSDWRAALSSVYAIYLIVEQESGHQYVGSAYNTTDGLWGRWSCYIATGGHGGNKKMVEVMKENPERCHNLQFSILQILPKTMSQDEVIRTETLWKDKLLTKSHGWNEN